MNPKLVYVVLLTLIALAVVPFGMNAIGSTPYRVLDPGVFRLFLGTALLAWTTLVLFSVYLSFARHELANFGWLSVIGVFGSFLALNLILTAIR